MLKPPAKVKPDKLYVAVALVYQLEQTRNCLECLGMSMEEFPEIASFPWL